MPLGAMDERTKGHEANIRRSHVGAAGPKVEEKANHAAKTGRMVHKWIKVHYIPSGGKCHNEVRVSALSMSC